MSKVEHARADDDDGGVVVSSGGVQVRKWVAADAAAVPVVKYEVASARDEPVDVAVTDQVPEHLEPEDVGFHDDFHGDRWRRPEPREIRFETRLEAREDVTTVYGVRQDEIEDGSAFRNRPDVEVAVAGASSASDAAASASDDVVDERLDRALEEAAAASGEAAASDADTATLSLADPVEDGDDGGDGEGGLEEGETAAGDRAESAESSDSSGGAVWDDATPADALGGATDAGSDGPQREETTSGAGDEDVKDGQADGSGTQADGARTQADGTGAAGTAGSAGATDEVASGSGEPGRSSEAADDATGDDRTVVERLATELESGDVDAETREALGRELNLELSASSSQFVDHLQSRMKDKRGQLETDIENLEDSIAELYGTKADSSLVSTVRAEKADDEALAEVSAAVDALEDAKADLADVQALEETLSELEAAAAMESELEETAGDLRDRVAALDASIAEVDDRTASEEGVEELAHGVSDLDERTPSRDAFEDLRGDHEQLREDAAMSADLATVERELADLDASLRDRIESDVERLEERLEEETTVLDERVEEEAAARASAVSDARERLDTLEARKADAERVATLETDLERRYVTEDDITAALESRLRTSLFARTLLVAAGASAGGGVALAATGTLAGAALVVVALGLFGYWWKLNDEAIDVASS